MRIGIIGTRGIPNNYGGFEQFAEYLSLGLVENGFEVYVYNSHNHTYKKNEWNGVKIIHCYDPEVKLGTIGQFIYDLNCIIDSRKRNFDIILQLGYTSSSVWGRLLPRKNCIITTNMDGLEWMRSKYSKQVQKFLLYAEKLGVKHSDFLISDSIGIQQYLKSKYNVDSDFIPYGAHIFSDFDVNAIKSYQVKPYNFNMLIARLEPENSIEIILDGVVESKTHLPFIVIGKHETKYGSFLKKKYKDFAQIRFVGGIYDINILNNLRYFSNIYFHGHTVGGTNPSLLEAMSSCALICAHNNIFNKSILKEEAYYFSTVTDVRTMLESSAEGFKMIPFNEKMLKLNFLKVKQFYDWDIIVKQYIAHFISIKKDKKLLLEQELKATV